MRNAGCMFAAIVLLTACDSGTSRAPIREIRPISEGQQITVPEMSSAERFGYVVAENESRRDEPPSALTWETPEGWVGQPPRPMRLVTFAVGEDGAAECYVALLRGDAGGLEANVNRWRRQMGQGPLAGTELAELPVIEVLGAASSFIEIEGTYSGMSGEAQENHVLLGVVCLLDERSVFIKMMGPAAVVRPERERFVAFCESLK